MAKSSFSKRLKRTIFAYALFTFLAYTAYYEFWGKHVYLVTAYCNCPICINVPQYRDNKFASGKKLYWGAAAADSKVKFGSKIELVPLWPQDWFAEQKVLKGRNKFTVEDRGGKIKGKHIDLFIPDSMGGHKAALHWGARRMRLKINGKFAE